MKLERIKRWQWMIVGLMLGFLVARIRQMYTDDVLSDYGNTMNSVEQFETALTLTVKTPKYPNPVPAFTNIAVYPIQLRGQPRFLVAGKYCPGRPERTKDGKAAYMWRPYCFIAEKPVYKTRTDFTKLTKAGGPDYALQWKAISNPTVLDYMKIIGAARGVNFRYAWWAEPKKSLAIWMGTGFVAIGIFWPFLVNLIAFGTLSAPPEEKKMDLSKVKHQAPTPVKAPESDMTRKEMDQVERMTQDLEDKLSSALTDGSAAPAAPAAPVGPAPIKQLTATKMEVSGVEEHKDERAFGANADDFYPTERKAKPHDPT